MAKGKARSKKTSSLEQQAGFHSHAWVYYLALFLFGFILYANTIHHDYAMDDSIAITDNAFTKQGIHGIADIITKDQYTGFYGKPITLGGGRWRPLSLVTYALEYQFFGLNPHVSHWVNTLLYALSAIVLFITLQKILPGKSVFNYLVTLLFIVHPVHTEVVANIKSRDELLSFLGLCLTIFWLFKSIESGKIRFMILSCVAYFAALVSKENGITFVAAVPLLLVCLGNKTWKESILKSIPIFATAIIYIVVRWRLVGLTGYEESRDILNNPFIGATLYVKYPTITKILGKYLMLLIFPITLSNDYSFNQIPRVGWENIEAIASFVVYISLAAWAIVILLKKASSGNAGVTQNLIISYGILFYLITMSIVSNIFFNIGAPMAERFLYLPSLGFCLAVSVLLMRFMKITNWGILKVNMASLIRIMPVAAIIVLFSCRTIVRNADWKDNETLDAKGVITSPNSANTHIGYANDFTYKARNSTDMNERKVAATAAISEFRKAISINPDDTSDCDLYNNIGLMYYLTGDTAPAATAFKSAIKLKPDFAAPSASLGIILFKQKNYSAAIASFYKAIEYKPDYFDALAYSGSCYEELKDYRNAIFYFEKALKINPSNVELIHTLSGVYSTSGDSIKAAYYNSLAEKQR